MAYRPQWTSEQISLLRECFTSGMSVREIYELNVLPYTKNAIHKALLRFSISPRRNKIFKFNSNQRQRLSEFLIKNWKGKTPQDLTNLWNDSYPMLPINKRRVVNYLTRLNIKIPQGEVLRITRLRKRIESLRSKGLSPDVLLNRIKDANTKVMRKRLAKNLDIWTGMPLNLEELSDLI